MTRILIAHEHDAVRSGLRAIVESQPNWEVVAEASDGKEVILKAIEAKPDVAVIDYSLPHVSGIEVTRQIRTRLRKTEVLILTMHDNDTQLKELLKAGARGYLTTTDAQHYLIQAVEYLAIHKPFFTARASEALLESFLTRSSRARSTLSSRERIVLQLIAEGHSNKQAAAILNISIKTVESRRAAIMRKLNLRSLSGLVRYAIRNGIVAA